MEHRFSNHKLTAILYADVAAYSRLIERDEIGMHQHVMDLMDFVSETITGSGGKVLRYAGDAILAESSSILNLAQAAIDIQRELANRNQALDHEDRVQIRIGLNIGEVLEDRGEIFGEGVNLAARLEAAAEPGGLCVSAIVHDQVASRLGVEFADGGQVDFKNLSHSVQTYHWRPESRPDKIPGNLSADGKSSVAVLAFEDMSGDPDQEYFSDGITEDIITELSHFRDISVIARHSSFAFRGKSVDIAEVARKLNVKYVLKGSIRKSGQRVRVTAQLIDASTGTHVWADRYDRKLEDVFTLQDELVRVISTTMIGKLRHADREHAKRKSATSLAAYDCVVLGLDHFYRWTPEDNESALNLFKQAISIDPDYACAHAWLAQAYFREGLNLWSSSHENSFSLLFDHANKAVALDDNDSLSHTALAIANLFRGEHELARAHFERALALNPSNTDAMVHFARWHALTGNPDKGLVLLNEALEYNPLANYQWFVGQIEYIAERYEEAVQALISISSPNALVHAFLAASYGQLGNLPAATRQKDEFIARVEVLLEASGAKAPDSWIDLVLARYPFKDEADADRLRSGLGKAGFS